MRAVVFEEFKHPVSVEMPVYKRFAIAGVIPTPELIGERAEYLRASRSGGVNAELLRVFGVRAVVIDAKIDSAAVLLRRFVGGSFISATSTAVINFGSKSPKFQALFAIKLYFGAISSRTFESAAFAERLQHMHPRA